MGFIELEKITKEYFMGDQKILAVNQASFSINQGELVVILGPSGAGKSTILNLLGGMDTATSGQLFVDGQDITALKESQLTDYRASEVGFVFQFYNLIPALTVYENIALIKEATSKALEPEGVLKSVGLWERRHLFPTQISGGEQQRTAIARALCKNPKLLLCDEPTGALDSKTGIVILTLLQNMSREKGHTVVIVTHNAALAEMADKVIQIKNGRVADITLNTAPRNVSEVRW
ncbi:ABC transporter ATP-binding protein [Eubacterium maltosivorans]|uniref:ABC transporter ATP-binding protein n=1 Tax=Eubacterium maltosivorans TaxID=2041044 RepID=A0A4P9C9V6_EUBML|nr:ABC transporter ATP-binding protein [Eubacterium maltosivorans]QCT71472.1 ABC transporter ATP-binding protein [Eubacterium maltosivorans]